MKELQFSIVVLMVLMCSTLILLMPGRVKRDKVSNRSRWLMVGSLGLIGMQFLIQYVTGLRAMGVTQAVLVNLTLLLPASGLMSLAILNLQRQGRLSTFEQWLWPVVSLLVVAVLTVVVWTDGSSIEQLSERVREAEVNAEEEKSEVRGKMTEGDALSAETMKHIDRAVERWLATGAHLKAGITNPVAAEAMNIPRYQLTAWVKATGHTSFTRWITTLRIDEAKRVLRAHPEWTNEAVADHCGFSRTHFQKIFKQETGIAPSEFVPDMI